jgi:hypothetical protein
MSVGWPYIVAIINSTGIEAGRGRLGIVQKKE